MSEQELMEQLELDVDALDFKSIKENLMAERLVAQALDPEVTDYRYEDLLDDAQSLADFQRRTLARTGGYTGPRPGRSQGVPLKVELTPYERACADTYARYLGVVGRKAVERDPVQGDHTRRYAAPSERSSRPRNLPGSSLFPARLVPVQACTPCRPHLEDCR